MLRLKGNKKCLRKKEENCAWETVVLPDAKNVKTCRTQMGQGGRDVSKKLRKHVKTSSDTCRNMWHYVKTIFWLMLRKIYENMHKQVATFVKICEYEFVWLMLLLSWSIVGCKIWDDISVSVLLFRETQKYFLCFSVFCSLDPNSK